MFNHLSERAHPISEIIFDQIENKIWTERGDHGVIRNEAKHQPFSVSHKNTSIRFENSAISHFIQIADIVAYNVFRHFVDTGTSLDECGKGVIYDHLEKIIPALNHKTEK